MPENGGLRTPALSTAMMTKVLAACVLWATASASGMSSQAGPLQSGLSPTTLGSSEPLQLSPESMRRIEFQKAENVAMRREIERSRSQSVSEESAVSAAEDAPRSLSLGSAFSAKTGGRKTKESQLMKSPTDFLLGLNGVQSSTTDFTVLTSPRQSELGMMSGTSNFPRVPSQSDIAPQNSSVSRNLNSVKEDMGCLYEAAQSLSSLRADVGTVLKQNETEQDKVLKLFNPTNSTNKMHKEGSPAKSTKPRHFKIKRSASAGRLSSIIDEIKTNKPLASKSEGDLESRSPEESQSPPLHVNTTDAAGLGTSYPLEEVGHRLRSLTIPFLDQVRGLQNLTVPFGGEIQQFWTKLQVGVETQAQKLQLEMRSLSCEVQSVSRRVTNQTSGIWSEIRRLASYRTGSNHTNLNLPGFEGVVNSAKQYAVYVAPVLREARHCAEYVEPVLRAACVSAQEQTVLALRLTKGKLLQALTKIPCLSDSAADENLEILVEQIAELRDRDAKLEQQRELKHPMLGKRTEQSDATVSAANTVHMHETMRERAGMQHRKHEAGRQVQPQIQKTVSRDDMELLKSPSPAKQSWSERAEKMAKDDTELSRRRIEVIEKLQQQQEAARLRMRPSCAPATSSEDSPDHAKGTLMATVGEASEDATSGSDTLLAPSKRKMSQEVYKEAAAFKIPEGQRVSFSSVTPGQSRQASFEELKSLKENPSGTKPPAKPLGKVMQFNQPERPEFSETLEDLDSDCYQDEILSMS